MKKIHTLTQTSTVSAYIQNSEAALNLIRRDSPRIPHDYYVVHSFISFTLGLENYIQCHLQCNKPTNMQKNCR